MNESMNIFEIRGKNMENVENVDKLKTDAENRVKSGIKKRL